MTDYIKEHRCRCPIRSVSVRDGRYAIRKQLIVVDHPFSSLCMTAGHILHELLQYTIAYILFSLWLSQSVHNTCGVCPSLGKSLRDVVLLRIMKLFKMTPNAHELTVCYYDYENNFFFSLWFFRKWDIGAFNGRNKQQVSLFKNTYARTHANDTRNETKWFYCINKCRMRISWNETIAPVYEFNFYDNFVSHSSVYDFVAFPANDGRHIRRRLSSGVICRRFVCPRKIV